MAERADIHGGGAAPLAAADVYGLMAEFNDPVKLVAAAHAARAAGYRAMDAYTPFPIEELPEALGLKPSRLPWLVLLGGIVGGVGAYLLQYYTAVIDYPINVGGRPYHSWPSFVPVTFEGAILVASLVAVFGMIAANRLPLPYHPVFNARGFDRASSDRLFLCIQARDPRFDRVATRELLETLEPIAVQEVPW